MTDHIERLAELARKALIERAAETWTAQDLAGWEVNALNVTRTEAEADLIAACSPQTILALCAEVGRLTKENETFRSADYEAIREIPDDYERMRAVVEKTRVRHYHCLRNANRHHVGSGAKRDIEECAALRALDSAKEEGK